MKANTQPSVLTASLALAMLSAPAMGSQDTDDGWGTSCESLDLTQDGTLDDQDIVEAFIQDASLGTEYIVQLGIGGFLSFPYSCDPAEQEFEEDLEEFAEDPDWSEEQREHLEDARRGSYEHSTQTPICTLDSPFPCAQPDVVYLPAKDLLDREAAIDILANDLLEGDIVIDLETLPEGVEASEGSDEFWLEFAPTSETPFMNLTEAGPRVLVVPYRVTDTETGAESESAVWFIVDEESTQNRYSMPNPPGQPWPEGLELEGTEEAIEADIQTHLPNGDGSYRSGSNWSYICCTATLAYGHVQYAAGGKLTLECNDNLTGGSFSQTMYMGGVGAGLGVGKTTLYVCPSRTPRAGDFARMSSAGAGLYGLGYHLTTLNIYDGTDGELLGGTVGSGSTPDLESFLEQDGSAGGYVIGGWFDEGWIEED